MAPLGYTASDPTKSGNVYAPSYKTPEYAIGSESTFDKTFSSVVDGLTYDAATGNYESMLEVMLAPLGYSASEPTTTGNVHVPYNPSYKTPEYVMDSESTSVSIVNTAAAGNYESMLEVELETMLDLGNI